MSQPPEHALRLGVDGRIEALHSLEEAAIFIRRHPMGEYAGSLLDQIASASNPLLTGRAWVAVTTFADVMQRSERVTPTRRICA